MRTLNHEQGAVAVLVALILPILLGFAALTIDLGALRVLQVQAQTAADAAALAVAAECAAVGCPDAEQTMTAFVVANNAQTGTLSLNTAAKQVAVVASAQHLLMFGEFIGASNGQVSASATAAWDTPNPRLVE